MKKIITLVVLLFCSLHLWAQDSLVDSINDIKRNMAFVYGEATEESRQRADSLARTDLLLNIQAWVFKNAKSIVDEELDKRISSNVKTICTRRANKIRVFVYVQKYDVMPLLADMGIHFEDSTVVDALQTPQKQQVDTEKLLATSKKLADIFAQGADKPKTRNEVLNRILKAKTFFELRTTLRTLIDQKAITSYGKGMTSKQPENCYWVIYDRAGNIKAVLGKGKDKRKNLKTNRNESLTIYEGKGYGAIWFQIAENNKKTQKA